MKLQKRIESLVFRAKAGQNSPYDYMSSWFAATELAAIRLQNAVETSLDEFDNLSLALSALQSNVPIIENDILLNGQEALLAALLAYDSDGETPYASVIRVTKEAMISVSDKILGSIINLKMLENAMGIEHDEPVAKKSEPEPEKPVEEQKSETDKSLEQSVKDALKPEPEKPAEEQKSSEPTLFGVPISELMPEEAKETPEDVEKIIKTEEVVQTKSRVPNDPKLSRTPQRVSKGWSELHIPDMPTDGYMISPKNLIVDRFTGRTVRPFNAHGEEHVEFRNFFTGVKKTMKFDDVILLAKGIEPKSPEVAEDPWVYVDWIPDIPRRKYKVFQSGKVYDTVHESYLPYDKKYETVRLSAGDMESRNSGSRSAYKIIKRQSLVWQAFHKETREQKWCYISFKDGNRQNCALSNLYIGKSSPK